MAPLITLPLAEPLTQVFQDELARRGIDWPPALELAGLDLVQSYAAGGFGVGLTIDAPGLLLPEGVRDAPRHALEVWDRAIPGFAGPDGQLVGLESRSSGPVRMPRDRERRTADGFANLYPWRHRTITEHLKSVTGDRKELVGNILDALHARMEETGVPCRINGRQKSPYSIYQKMERYAAMALGGTPPELIDQAIEQSLEDLDRPTPLRRAVAERDRVHGAEKRTLLRKIKNPLEQDKKRREMFAKLKKIKQMAAWRRE